MAQSQATKRVTRKGSKQLTDEERASQVASPIRSPSPTIPPGEAEDNSPGGSPLFTPEIMQGVREAQKKRVKMTPEERTIEIEKTRLSMGMLPMAIVRQMKADDKKREERAKQRANTRGSAVPNSSKLTMTLMKMKMTATTTTGRTASSLTTATPTLKKVGIETPMTTTLVTTATPTTITLSQPMMNKQGRRTSAKEKPHKCHPGSQ